MKCYLEGRDIHPENGIFRQGCSGPGVIEEVGFWEDGSSRYFCERHAADLYRYSMNPRRRLRVDRARCLERDGKPWSPGKGL